MECRTQIRWEHYFTHKLSFAQKTKILHFWCRRFATVYDTFLWDIQIISVIMFKLEITWHCSVALDVLVVCFHRIAKYTFGGGNGAVSINNVYMFDEQWISRSPIPVDVGVFAIVVLIDNTSALICGGVVSTNPDDLVASKSCYNYTATHDKWAKYAWELNVARKGHAMTMYKQNVYVYGGDNGDSWTYRGVP